MSGDLVWKDPPPIAYGRESGSGRPKVYAPIVEMLKKQPGQWALVRHYENPDSAPGIALQFKKLGCEATGRRNPDGGSDVYARWPLTDTNGATP